MFKKKFLKIKNKNDTKHNLIFKDYQPNNIISVEPKFIHRTDLKKKKKKLITCQLITLGVTRTASSKPKVYINYFILFITPRKDVRCVQYNFLFLQTFVRQARES